MYCFCLPSLLSFLAFLHGVSLFTPVILSTLVSTLQGRGEKTVTPSHEGLACFCLVSAAIPFLPAKPFLYCFPWTSFFLCILNYSMMAGLPRRIIKVCYCSRLYSSSCLNICTLLLTGDPKTNVRTSSWYLCDSR